MPNASLSLSVLNQLPSFIRENDSLFEKFLQSYYRSQEKTSQSFGILNNMSDYLNLTEYDVKKVNGTTFLLSNISEISTNIDVESTDGFVEENGSVIIDNEVIYYESIKKSPSVTFSSGISYEEFSLKKIPLFNPYLQFNGIQTTFNLTANKEPIFASSSNHIIVKLYNQYLIPGVDYNIYNDTIVFTEAPRTFNPTLSDTSSSISIEYLKGFAESNIDVMDSIPLVLNQLEYRLKLNNIPYNPASTILSLVISDGNLLIPHEEFSVYNDKVILKYAPNDSLYFAYINANLLSVGDGAEAVSVVSSNGAVTSVKIKNGGSGYTLNNTPEVSLVKSAGINATAKALVGGLKQITLIGGGQGYSQSNPPGVYIQPPTNDGGTQAKASVVINSSGLVESIELTNSGSGYDFEPRIQFINPSGASIGNVQVNSSGVITSVQVLTSGSGYTTAPQIYVDAPITTTGIPALLRGVLNSNGELTSVNVINGGTGYSSTNLPKVAVIQPTGAQVLNVSVDDFGRVTSIELLYGGFGYSDVPSVYIVDDRKDNLGNSIGGTGAKAVATIFNGQITDISLVEFGSGYSSQYPPTVYISTPIQAKATASVGENEITGCEIINGGSGYTPSQFVDCSRGVSGIIGYDSNNNLIFSDETKSVASSHLSESTVKSLDSIFFKKVLERITNQYLPDLPNIDFSTINVANVLRTAKDFYSSKGTKYSIAYLFKLLYGEDIEVSYPKDQLIKPSAASWSIDTILRCKVVSGNTINLKDGLIEQFDDAVDTNIKYSQALIENFTAIQTADFELYELILSEESITGSFKIPYTTKLAEKLSPTDAIITVDSTIGWPERNGEVLIGTELIRYKEKSLTQFIECTRGINGSAQSWDSGTICNSNFYVYVNKDTSSEVVLSILGIVEANKTVLLDDGSYYLTGDKLSVSKLGSTEDNKLLTSWLYNVKKLLKVESITYGGVGNQTATVTCSNPHGLLVGDQVTVYGANPIVYNGTFFVTSRESATIFKYTLPQPATINPQGNILISIDLNKGKSDSTSINTAISKFATNIQNSFFNTNYVYIATSGLPNYKIGPFSGTALLPGNQRKLYRFPKVTSTISLKDNISPGPIGSFVNGVSIWSYKSTQTYSYGPVTKVSIDNPGSGYDADVPPIISFSGGGGSGASATVVVNGSLIEIEVTDGGSGYETTPLVSIAGGGGEGASATAVISSGAVTRILVDNSGTGFTSAPEISIVGGGGIGATAEAKVRGPIKEVNITSGGADYTSSPTIRLSSGSGAAAQAYVSNGRIISIAVISAGGGYTTAPKVIISGDGFGAIAKATISTEGADTGRVTGITILNRGIGYNPGTTSIRLESIGDGAEFSTNIFEWTFNLNNTTSFDYANGSIFEGYNKQFGGEYAHMSNPKQLRFVLGDNINIINGQLIEKTSGIVHSPIIGWAFDGNPIYGPYGLSDPTSLSSTVAPIQSSYQLKTNLVYNVNINPTPYRIQGPSLTQFPAGTFIDDYQYVFRSESIYLDQYNGRFCKTPEFPEGTYAYFVTLTSAGLPAFPYIIGPNYYSTADTWNLNQFATQANIPTGIVRYRDPFENVDIDIQRAANESTNALTLENGDYLTFDVEDENDDGVISNDETIDPDIVFEESKLELFDYFPTIDISSRVDIEVETTTKFEDAKISAFLIENAGINYQVNDKLLFDDTGTEGYGASASVQLIEGKDISAYTYEYNQYTDSYYGVVTTTEPHTLEVGNYVIMSTTPAMEPTSKTFKVITVSGLEELAIEKSGIGYDEEIPVETSIETSSGQDTIIQPIVTSTGSIDEVNIINSGYGFTSNPRIRVSHPQIQKKADYFATLHTHETNVYINNGLVMDDKSHYIVGRTKGTAGDTHGFIKKFTSEGSSIWNKSLSSVQPSGQIKSCEFVALTKYNNFIYVVGQTRPNQTSSDTFNPDILLAKYTENSTGSSATLAWQKEIAGVSGITRNDYVTDIVSYENNLIICGYTNTNTSSTFDGFVILVNSNGDFVTKRKITSTSNSEKFNQIKIDSNNNIYVVGESNANNILVTKLSLTSSRFLVTWSKEISLTGIKFADTTISIDEFDELYITSTHQVISTGDRTKVYMCKLNSSGSIILNKLYTIPSLNNITLTRTSIDTFGDINFSVSGITSTDKKAVSTIKIKYEGTVLESYTHQSSTNIGGLNATACISDVSGDPLVLGNTYTNRTNRLYRCENNTESTGFGSNLTTSGTVTYVTDPKFGTNAVNLAVSATITSTSLTLSSTTWTLEGWFKLDTAPTNKAPNLLSLTDGTTTLNVLLFADSSAPSTNGKLRLDITGSAANYSTQTNATSLLTGTYRHLAVTKSFSSSVATYTVYLNGSQYAQVTSSTNLNPTSFSSGSTTAYNSSAIKVDDIRYSDYLINYSTTAVPTVAHSIFDYGESKGFIIKFDKNADAERMGTITLSNCGLTLARANSTISTITTPSTTISTYQIGSEGIQVLDFNYTTSYLTQDYHLQTSVSDKWSSRTATIPSPGGRKLILSTNAYDKFFLKTFATSSIDNVRKLTLNQSFEFNVGSNLIQKNSSNVTVATAKIVDIGTSNDIYIASLTGTLSLNSGTLESSDLVANQISNYVVANVINTTPGTFIINLATIPYPYPQYNGVNLETWKTGTTYTTGTRVVYGLKVYQAVAGGTSGSTAPTHSSGTVSDGGINWTWISTGSPISNIAKFKTYSPDDYSIRIDDIITGSSYVKGSVVSLNSGNYSFNSARSQVTVTGLTSVTQITLVTNLTKILQISSIDLTNQLYVRTATTHYLNEGDKIFTKTTPSYSYANGSFTVANIISKLEFLTTLRQIPTSIPTGTVLEVYVKHPILKFIYGQQYTFDLSDSSNVGHYLSFYRDNLNKIEYTFKNIIRVGTPGIDAPGASPFISFKVTDDVSNISYYADPSRIGGLSPVSKDSYVDVVRSPYIGTFQITELSGATVTTGANRFKFKLSFEPEKPAVVSTSSYSTSSTKAVGSISKIRLINGGGFYKKLPSVSDIISSRKIERVEIQEPGTEYAAGEYFGIPILGDGTGGKVRILVDGNSDPAGQIVEVVVTDPGKNYTTAYIDVDGIDGILGPSLAGSGAVLNVIIPPKGSGASIFTIGERVGKIKKLKNNNFGFNYTHDYTLRPEITFPVNLQLTSTSVLSNITITNPGIGYTTPPEVIIVGGGGSGAIAVSELKNGRISSIIIKNAGSGYSSSPTVQLKSSFTYIVNLDLGLFQFAFPHGIQNGSEVTFTVQDLGQGTQYPITSFGYISPNQTYYAISGTGAGLEDNQLRIALTAQDAVSGNYISFVNAGIGRQIILTESFGGAAESVVETARFLAGEQVYQGESLENATAIGYVSKNDGWQIGPRLLKLIDYTGTFSIGQKVSGVVSKATGTINNLSIAKGVLEVDSITKTTGKFLDDIGKPSEIVQKIQDSYLYQAFSYNIKSPVSIDKWKTIVNNNVHAAGFKAFGEIGVVGAGKGLTDKTDFEITKSVNLIESSVVSNIDNFALVEPIYKDYDNTQVLFRSKRLTSSEEILTSVVQKLDNISSLFDGERTIFPLTINGTPVVANTNQFMIVINGVSQAPGVAFTVQSGSIIFSEPPAAPTKISYAKLTLQFLVSKSIIISNVSGILPELGATVRGLTSNATATVVTSTTGTIKVFNVTGTFQNSETIICASTGLNATIVSSSNISTNNVYEFQEKIINLTGKTAVIEQINLISNTNTVSNNVIISKTSGTYDSPSGLLAIVQNDYIISAKTGIVARVTNISPYIDAATNQPISSISISDPSNFYGLLFNRIVSPTNPNVIVDDISKSIVEVSSLEDSLEKVEGNFVAFEDINNIMMDYNVNYRTPKTIGVNGNATISTANKKYGNSSIIFDGTGDYLSVSSSADFGFGTGDFTIEAWIRPSSFTNYQSIFDFRTTANETAIAFYVNTSGQIYIYTNNTIRLTSNNILTANTWNHVAYSRTSGVGRLFINGVLQTSTYNDSANYASKPVRIGSAYDASYSINGYLDEIRISKGISRYTSSFTTSLLPFVNDAYTKLLIHAETTISDDGGIAGALISGEYIQNIALEYANETGDFTANETIEIRKLAYRNLTGGNFAVGTTITGTSSGITANIVGINYNLKHLYLGNKSGAFTIGETITATGGKSAIVSGYINLPFIANQVNTSTNKIITGQFYDDTQHRFRDASNLLRLNANFIVDVAAGRLKDKYPDLIIPGDVPGSSDGTSRCKLDLSLLLNAVVEDVENGGQYNTVTAAKFYIDSTGGLQYIATQVLQSVYAHTQMALLCKQAILGQLSSSSYTSQIPVPPVGVTVDAGNCANVTSQIDTLWNIINDTISPTGQVYRDAGNLIWFNKNFIAQESVGYVDSVFTYNLNGINYRAFDYPGGSSTTCKRDLTEYILPAIISDLVSGGNSNTINAISYYVGGTTNKSISYIKNELLPTVYALEKANTLCQYAIDNWIITGTASTVYTAQYGATASKYTDNTITVDSGTYGGHCANIKSAINTLFTTAIGIILPTTQVKRDAAKLLMFNKRYFQYESLQRTLNNYPGFSVPGGNTKCLRDIGYIVDAVVYDLLTNGNSGIVTATQSYINATTGTITSLDGELIQSIYAYTWVRDFMKLSVAETLTSPGTASGTYSYTDSGISISGSNLTTIQTFIDNEMAILLGTLNNPTYITTNNIVSSTSISIPSITYPTRTIPTPLDGKIKEGDYLYGLTSTINAEIKSIATNRANVKTLLKRFQINYTSPTEIFSINNTVTIQGLPANECTVYSTYNDGNFDYIDVIVNSGSFSTGNILLNDNNFTATITLITDRVQLVNLIGEFDSGQFIRGLKSTSESSVLEFEKNIAPVLDITGSKLTLETESISGILNKTNIVYSSISEYYIDVIDVEGTQVELGDIIQTTNILRLTVSYPDSNNKSFPQGESILRSTNFAINATIIGTETVGSTNYIYIGNSTTTPFANGNTLYHFETPTSQFPNGIATVTAITTIASSAYGTVNKVIQLGEGYRIYLSDIKGTFNKYAQVIAPSNYKSLIANSTEIVGRITRTFRGFDGIQTSFKLTTQNGLPYFPDSDGHLLVFINGILQPPVDSYSAFSDVIQFIQAPDLGSSFNAVYIGKLRKLDDISFEFDSLKNSFNLKLNDVFYSLTITEGVSSNTIKPENNIIVSLNGVIQEPGIAFEIVGSRVIFAEVPRAGSSFVAFSYIGSDADVIAATVVPPIESGDQLEIEGEDGVRDVAVIESSNSLITYDYLGSIFGRNASALTQLVTGRIESVQLTSGGDGYISRPSVSLDSSTGFGAQIKALVGISRVDVSNRGSGYSYPSVEVVTNIPTIPSGFNTSFDDTDGQFDSSIITFDAS